MVSQELKKTLWAAADKLRSNMDAAEYKHIVLGLIFLKYVSDTFSERQEELLHKFTDPDDEYYLPDQDSLERELEDRDYYTEANVFWVPEAARWESIRNNAKQPNLGKLIDDALVDIETENPRLKNILDKRFARTELEPGRLGELVDLISKIGFGGKEKARDVLGEVYEYFLGQFANAEGKKGGQFYTPASVVRVIVEIIAPHRGKVYDPCCGSGGMFVQSEKFIESHGGRFGDISIYGQEGNPTTWRLVAMNLAIRGMDFNLGKEPADSFTRDQHPDLRADYIMANPPFNVSDWWNEKLVGDARWEYGTPPAGNANYAWLSHILYHLKLSGMAGVVLANGSMSSGQSNEETIRKEMIERDVVDCIVALPSQLFINTQIPACLWFLTKDKRTNGRDRRGEILFIDARKLGRMETRVNRVFDDEDIAKIATVYHAWRTDSETKETYQNLPGFAYAASKEEVKAHDYTLTPGRYVGAEEMEDDAEAFVEKMQRLTAHLADQMQESQAMDAEIKKQLARVGFTL